MVDVKMSRAPLGEGKNWVTEAGGLPPRWRGAVRHLQARGYDESRAIATAVNWAKKQCATGRAFGGQVKVSAEAQAAACKEVAEWDAKRAAARATPNKSDMATTPCGCQGTVDLAGAWDGAKHPRVSKGKSGGGRFAAKQGQQQQQAAGSGGPLPPEMAAQVRDFQKRHGLAQTGTFDAATTASVHYHASGAAAKAAAGSKRHAKAVLSAQKRAARRKAAAARKAARAKTSAAKKSARAKASAAKKAAAAKLSAAKKQASALVGVVNRLTPAQRKAFRAKAPNPPAGYAWTKDNHLVTTTTAAATATVSKTLGGTAGNAAAVRAQIAAVVSAVNSLTSAQRAVYRRKAPTPPAGYVWGRNNRLVAAPTATQQQASAQVAKTVGLAEQVKAIDLALDPAKLTFMQRIRLRRKGQAMAPAAPGGQPRFPIRNHDDLRKAIHAVGRAKGDHDKVRAHIVRRAKALGMSHLIPNHWNADGSMK